MRRALVAALLALALAGVAGGAAPESPTLRFRVAVDTHLPYGDVLWTGKAFLYVLEGLPDVYTSDAGGRALRRFTAVPNAGETRCRLSPGTHGFPAGIVFCHVPDGRIFRVAPDGSTRVFASLPKGAKSDGALTFDTVGDFGYGLVAATGGSTLGPGDLFAIAANGRVRRIGSYPGPGGAENVAIAPRGFGSAGGQALVTIDQEDKAGRLLAIDARGRVRTLMRGVPEGLNPIAVIARGAASGAPAGLYLADWSSETILFAPASQLRAHAGEVVVGSEHGGFLWLVRPEGRRFRAVPVRTNLAELGLKMKEGAYFNLEGAAYLP